MQDASVVEWIQQKYEFLWATMNERSRRRWAATEAWSLGWGGVTTVAVATGLIHKTIHSGIRELEAEALRRPRFRVSDLKAAVLLEETGYSLQSNRKTREGKSHPDRNAQSEHINEPALRCQRR